MSKKNALSIMAIAGMLAGNSGFDFSGLGGGKYIGHNSQRLDVFELTDETGSEFVLKATAKLQAQLEAWEERDSKYVKYHTVQGFTLSGVSLRSTRQRLRKFLAISGLHPDTEFELLREHILKANTHTGIDAGLTKLPKL